MGSIDILSDTMGVDFAPYLGTELNRVKKRWYRLMPASAASRSLAKRGNVSVSFVVLKGGSIVSTKLDKSCGDAALDNAALDAIKASNPFHHLPANFPGSFLSLRVHFAYNPNRE